MVERVLEKMGTTVRALGAMNKVVAQSVLLYGREIWVVTGNTLNILEGFHHQTALWITGLAAKRETGGVWDYSLVVEAMEAAGIHPIGE